MLQSINSKVNVAVEKEVEAGVADVVSQFGRVDVLVNNAAAFVFGTVEQATEQDWDKVLGVNVKGTDLRPRMPFIICTHHAHSHHYDTLLKEWRSARSMW